MKIYAVGMGPGSVAGMTQRALTALQESDVIVGYPLYLELLGDLIKGKTIKTTPMRKEVDRCNMAVEEALKGQTVSMVSSGDVGIYGMAGVLYECAEPHPEIEIEVVPGITAASSGGAVLGAPLMHDFAVISLSDLLTPWETITKRLRMAAEADFVLCLYNPSSKKRADYLKKACAIVGVWRDENTPCGIVRNIARADEKGQVLSLKELAVTPVDMLTTVFIGNSHTKIIHGKLVTPRGYRELRSE